VARARPHRSFGARSKRLTQWVGPAGQGFVAVAAGGATLINNVPFTEASTIIRIRGMMSVQPQAFSASLDIVGAYGEAIVSQEAFAAGVASIPEPFSDADWSGWMVWRSFSYHLESSSTIGITELSWNDQVDSKSMRKVGPNDVLVGIAESQGGAFEISVPFRTLVKLS